MPDARYGCARHPQFSHLTTYHRYIIHKSWIPLPPIVNQCLFGSADVLQDTCHCTLLNELHFTEEYAESQDRNIAHFGKDCGFAVQFAFAIKVEGIRGV